MATPSMNLPKPKLATGKIQPTNYGALSTLVIVFFFWGFIAVGNSVSIPFCKHYFHFGQFQSQLIDFAFTLPIISAPLHSLPMAHLVVTTLLQSGAIKEVLFMDYYSLHLAL
jgi:fucose permease